jgi:hypothetical protein
LDDPWKGLIDKAVVASHHEEQDDFLEETLDFIRFTKEQTIRLQHAMDTTGMTHDKNSS